MKRLCSRARILIFVSFSVMAIGPAWADDDRDERRPANKGVDLRSHGRQLADRGHESRGDESRHRREGREDEGQSVQINDPEAPGITSIVTN